MKCPDCGHEPSNPPETIELVHAPPAPDLMLTTKCACSCHKEASDGAEAVAALGEVEKAWQEILRESFEKKSAAEIGAGLFDALTDMDDIVTRIRGGSE